jgi:murein DD-endopeptidase MepM/ murein hydrolase activator NlpD
MSMVGKIQSLTGGVDKLTKSADALLLKLIKINEVAGKSIHSANQAINTTGGSLNLTQGTKVPLGTDNARMPVAAQQVAGGNILSGSMGGFSFMSNGMVAGNAAMGIATSAVNGFLGSIPDLGTTMQNQLGYYQAALKSPGISRMALERSTIRSMNGGFSSTLGGSITAGTLASAGFSPGNANYRQAVGEVGNAYNMLGMDNQTAAASVANMHSGAMGANLFQYGITTYNPKTGKDKTTGQIARELMNVMGAGGATTEQVRQSYQKGALGANLSTMGFDQATQTRLYQAMIDISSGKNPDSTKANKGNDNTALTAAGRMNAAQAKTMTSVETSMTKGFEHAADAVEAFNRALTGALGPLTQLAAQAQGFVGGVKGTNAGPALKSGTSILKRVAGLGLLAAAGGMEIFSGGAATLPAVALGTVGLGMATNGGGSTNGYGASFGRGGGRGGSAPVSAGISAAYGTQDTSGLWASTNNAHTGTDYNVPVGTPVTAAMDGVVSSTDLGPDYGMAIMVDHPGGYQTIYAHLSEKDAKVGQTVAKGQRLGKSGNSGNSTGAHLHFEVRHGKNNPVNPDTLLGASNDILNPYFATILPTQGDVTGSSASTPGGSANLKATPGAGAADGNAVAMQQWLMSQGMSANGAAGVVSNLLAESGLRTGAVGDQGSSYGIAQWHLGRKDNLMRFAKSAGLDPSSLDAQSQFLMKELRGKQYGNLMSTLSDPKVSAYDATAAFMKTFERPADTSVEAVTGRYNRGQSALAPSGGGAYGTSFGDTSAVTGGNNTVNVTLKIERASDEEAERFARKVTDYIQKGTEISMMGRS